MCSFSPKLDPYVSPDRTQIMMGIFSFLVQFLTTHTINIKDCIPLLDKLKEIRVSSTQIMPFSLRLVDYFNAAIAV